MNDMTHPNTAARISDDIGDVLSAIRRLIAEDEAMGDDAAQDEPLKLAVGGDVLARRYGGNAALARQMVLSSHSGAEPDAAETRVAPDEILEFADETAMHPFEAAVLAIQDDAEDDAPAESTPLRLSEADRVIPSDAENEQMAAPRRRSRWARIGIPTYRRQTSQPAEPQPAAIGEEPTSFAAENTPMIEAVADIPVADMVADIAADLPPVEDMPVPPPVEAAPVAVAPEPAATNADVPQALRALIREMIQEELHGELGQRFSRNLRAVIRREVLAAIDDRM
ncbi:MAG: hypothetical protein Q4G49_07775 [Paracoccus sp. (in: a-proteobacteria)]|nr:hypothetical protein [Paracoccus sp. (in: a-proteobacteria)]